MERFVSSQSIDMLDRTDHIIGDVDTSNTCLEDAGPTSPVDKARCLKLKSNNAFLLNDFAGGLERTMEALELLGLKVNLKPTKEEMDALFEEVKHSILSIGFEKLVELPRATDSRIDLTIQLLTIASKDSDTLDLREL